jgi:hypothetical protein
MPIAEIRRQADNQDTPQDRHHHQTIAATSRIPLVIPLFTRNQTSTTGPNFKAKSSND